MPVLHGVERKDPSWCLKGEVLGERDAAEGPVAGESAGAGLGWASRKAAAAEGPVAGERAGAGLGPPGELLRRGPKADAGFS